MIILPNLLEITIIPSYFEESFTIAFLSAHFFFFLLINLFISVESKANLIKEEGLTSSTLHKCANNLKIIDFFVITFVVEVVKLP